MTVWSLPKLLAGLHRDIENRLATVRDTFAHAPTKGNASEKVWLDLLQTYLPKRYRVETAHVVDSEGAFSDQIDVVVFDQQYSPFIFRYEEHIIIPAESVYAVFEAKQTINAKLVAYAGEKAATVRRLRRTSIPIPHAGGTYEPKPLTHILAGVLSFESDWSPALGAPLERALASIDALGQLDLGCIATHGIFSRSPTGVALEPQSKPATAFLLELIARLQDLATVPMIDIRAYSQWLEK
jgi:hypothetical protein